MRGIRSTPESFWSKVNKLGPVPELTPQLGCCWLWLGRPTPRGYGHQRWDGKMMRAHRVAWLISIGPIPTGLFVLHHCDNPPCVNPAHLWLGTHDDNMRDRQEKGRTHVGPYADTSNWKRGDAHYSRTNPELLARGDRHPNVLISNAEVISMVEMKRDGKSVREIAEHFGYSTNTTWAAIRRRGPRLVNVQT